YTAVIADDEALVGITGPKLLSSVEELQPQALRILIARRERRAALSKDPKRFQLFLRPYFAAPVRDALLAHERSRASSGPRRPEGSDPQGTVAIGAAMLDADTKPYTLVSGKEVVRRRLLITMAELAENGIGHGAGHPARVAVLACALGRAIGMPLAELDALDEAAVLHDVGELRGPAQKLLRARRRLTAAELRGIHEHPSDS